MRFPEGRLLIFAKAPVPGQVKTRLAPALGEQGAADLHHFLVDDTLRRTVRADMCPAQLWCTPDCEHPAFRDWGQRHGVSLRRQEGADVGERMHHALAQALDTADYAVLAGTDCPELGADDVAAALDCLAAGCHGAFVPAEDGGYVLIGLRRSDIRLFTGIDWGGPRVMEQTRERLRSLGWRWQELPVRWDVDRPEDLARLARLPGVPPLQGRQVGYNGAIARCRRAACSCGDPMEFSPFYIATLPRILFGDGRIAELPAVVREHGGRALLVTGAHAFRGTDRWPRLLDGLEQLGVRCWDMTVEGEPSPSLVDGAVQRFRDQGVEVVVGIGGGSVLDAAKAVAGLLPRGNSVLDHLEDVGRGLPYTGPSLPFIAVPTTAGTGSEATKNAVLSERGAGGFKKSFRHECLVARVALVDPELLESCPPALVAAQGMDAFTQLMESYLSTRANPLTDALALSGIEAFKEGFFPAWEGGTGEAARHGRAAMAYAALLSGISLAQAGLGSVHGLAQPLGSLFPVPHGVACGTMVAAATRTNIEALRRRAPGGAALEKYARVGRLLGADPHGSAEVACDALVDILMRWTERLELPRLSAYGVTEGAVDAIVSASRNNSMRTNPIELSDEEIGMMVRQRL